MFAVVALLLAGPKTASPLVTSSESPVSKGYQVPPMFTSDIQ